MATMGPPVEIRLASAFCRSEDAQRLVQPLYRWEVDLGDPIEMRLLWGELDSLVNTAF